METQFLNPSSQTHYYMNSLSSKFKPLLSSKLLPFSSSSSFSLTPNQHYTRRWVSARNSLKLSSDTAVLKETWLDSLSCPLPDTGAGEDPTPTNADSGWVIGIDPDLSGALALLKTDSSGYSAQVY